jgi:hypothetical protein
VKPEVDRTIIEVCAGSAARLCVNPDGTVVDVSLGTVVHVEVVVPPDDEPVQTVVVVPVGVVVVAVPGGRGSSIIAVG